MLTFSGWKKDIIDIFQSIIRKFPGDWLINYQTACVPCVIDYLGY
jgi:hypothetical protein